MNTQKSHININEILPPICIKKIELNNDNIGYVELWDFSKANIDENHRIYYISQIASICYQNPKALGSISLYNRLATENKGLPSSSYEFVPVLLTKEQLKNIENNKNNIITTHTKCEKYGEWVNENNTYYLLTNLRALIADVGDKANQYYNSKEECAIIAKYFKVFKTKIDLATARQFMRHRVSWQEVSRRYVSGKRMPFEFYISPKMINQVSQNSITKDLISNTLIHYDTTIASGVKPEEARRILPQAMYTTIWSAWQPSQLDVLFKLRCDEHAQSEIQELAHAMKSLINIQNHEKDN